MTDSLRVWWKLLELSDRLTMLVMVETKSAEHSLRYRVAIIGLPTIPHYLVSDSKFCSQMALKSQHITSKNVKKIPKTV